MPTEILPSVGPLRLAALLVAVASIAPAQAQTDGATPFYAGGSLGASRVSNLYRERDATNDDTVTSVGLLAGLDQRLGRQHVTLDGSLQQNRYRANKDLNNRSHSLRAALNWETAGHLSGMLSAKSTRSLADFNIGGGVDPIFKKNIERSNDFQALARLGGGASRYTLEAGWSHRRRDFSAEEYARFDYRQDTASVGAYATPGGNLRLGLVARHTKGENPRYPLPGQPGAANDYKRDDIDFTTLWSTGGSSTLNTRLSRSKTVNSLEGLRDFSGTTGSIGWNWQPTAKLRLDLQYSRDTGQESVISAADLNRVYTSWQLGSSYALTSKFSISAKASSSRGRRASDSGTLVADALDDRKLYNLGLRWNIWRGFSLGCQYDRVSRDSSVLAYNYSASSYGCTGQALVY